MHLTRQKGFEAKVDGTIQFAEARRVQEQLEVVLQVQQGRMMRKE